MNIVLYFSDRLSECWIPRSHTLISNSHASSISSTLLSWVRRRKLKCSQGVSEGVKIDFFKWKCIFSPNKIWLWKIINSKNWECDIVNFDHIFRDKTLFCEQASQHTDWLIRKTFHLRVSDPSSYLVMGETLWLSSNMLPVEDTCGIFSALGGQGPLSAALSLITYSRTIMGRVWIIELLDLQACSPSLHWCYGKHFHITTGGFLQHSSTSFKVTRTGVAWICPTM